MESKEYFEKVMQDYNQNRKGRSLRKYCKDEAVDYDWLIQYKKNYPLQEKLQEPSQDAFIPIGGLLMAIQKSSCHPRPRRKPWYMSRVEVILLF